MTELETAFAELDNHIASLPFFPILRDFHNVFRELARSRFLIPNATWLSAFEIGAIAKWIYLEGHSRRKPNPVDVASVVNAYKKLWRASEANTTYPDNSAVIAAFVLRFAYQQLSWNITEDKLNANFKRVRGIYGAASPGATALRRSFEETSGTAFEDFLKIAHSLWGLFMRSSDFPDHLIIGTLHASFAPRDVSSALNILSCTRNQFRTYYQRVAAKGPAEVVYEFNPLFRFPILLREERLCCVFPELVNYAATRGLYFLIADSVGQNFSTAFAEAFEAYVAGLCGDKVGADHVFTEAQERSYGWTGKTNDVSLILDDTLLLIECKNSGLFSIAKRSGAPMDLVADIRKNLANAEKRKGLFQLHDKIEAIRTQQIPQSLRANYSTVKKFYPVLLLHDEIWFANRPEVLRNLIDSELKDNGISDFDYQIWHVEEFEALLNAVPKDQLKCALEEKFTDPRYRYLDLSAYLAKRFVLEKLGVHLFVPGGGSKAWNILRALADAESN